jgi:hypothetical protein
MALMLLIIAIAPVIGGIFIPSVSKFQNLLAISSLSLCRTLCACHRTRCWRKLDSSTPFHSLRSLLPYQPPQSLGPTISRSQSHCSTHYTPILPPPLSWIPPPPP